MMLHVPQVSSSACFVFAPIEVYFSTAWLMCYSGCLKSRHQFNMGFVCLCNCLEQLISLNYLMQYLHFSCLLLQVKLNQIHL
jgi:hypothetical protein